MSIIRREIELAIRIGRDMTEMSAVGIIAWHPDVEVLAMRSYCDRDEVVLLLVTTNSQKASQILEAAGFRCKANPVIVVGPLHRPGLAALLGSELAVLGIEILYSYASRMGVGDQHLVFKTTEDERAIQALEVSGRIHDMSQAKSWQDQSLVIGTGPSQQAAAA